MNERLRYYGFRVGDAIKAFDFEPTPGRDDRYLIGYVTAVNPGGTAEHPFAHYVVQVAVDRLYDSPPRETALVPMQTSLDFDGRIAKVDPLDTVDAGKLVRFARRALAEIVGGRLPTNVMQDLRRYADEEGLVTRVAGVPRVKVQRDEAFACVNCGAKGDLTSALADGSGDLHCPDCGSSDVDRLDVAELAQEAG